MGYFRVALGKWVFYICNKKMQYCKNPKNLKTMQNSQIENARRITFEVKGNVTTILVDQNDTRSDREIISQFKTKRKCSIDYQRAFNRACKLSKDYYNGKSSGTLRNFEPNIQF